MFLFTIVIHHFWDWPHPLGAPLEAYAALPSQRCAECLFDASGAGAKCLVAVSDISDGSINCGVVIFGDTDYRGW